MASSATTVKTTAVAWMAPGVACPKIMMIGDGLKKNKQVEGRCDEIAEHQRRMDQRAQLLRARRSRACILPYLYIAMCG